MKKIFYDLVEATEDMWEFVVKPTYCLSAVRSWRKFEIKLASIKEAV